MSSKEIVSLTASVGFQIGVTRTLPLALSEGEFVR